MKNGNVPREKISVLADGELESNELDPVLASLRQPDARTEWELYHQIGDVLRSEDMAVRLSPDFATRMAARLEAEPTILAPAALNANKAQSFAQCRTATMKRYAMPGIAAVLAVFTAYLVAPQLTTNGEGGLEQTRAPSALASASIPAAAPATPAQVLPTAVSASASATIDVNQDAVVLRDPNIDEYLLAHQRYSPSLYDTTQFVRSATFETEPQK